MGVISDWTAADFGKGGGLKNHYFWQTLSMDDLQLGKFLLLFRSNMLINYPFIKNEIHLKIGDHSGGSFCEMSFQVANVNISYCVNIKLSLERFKIQIRALRIRITVSKYFLTYEQ